MGGTLSRLYAGCMSPKYVVCRGGAQDNERYPLPRPVEPGYVFAWGSARLTSYQVQAEILQTNRGPMWVASPLAP